MFVVDQSVVVVGNIAGGGGVDKQRRTNCFPSKISKKGKRKGKGTRKCLGIQILQPKILLVYKLFVFQFQRLGHLICNIIVLQYSIVEHKYYKVSMK